MLLDQFNKVLDDADPLTKLGRGVWLLGQVAWGLAQLDPSKLPQPNARVPAELIQKMTCGYCRTLYLWSQNQACPNCGAPPQA